MYRWNGKEYTMNEAMDLDIPGFTDWQDDVDAARRAEEDAPVPWPQCEYENGPRERMTQAERSAARRKWWE